MEQVGQGNQRKPLAWHSPNETCLLDPIREGLNRYRPNESIRVETVSPIYVVGVRGTMFLDESTMLIETKASGRTSDWLSFLNLDGCTLPRLDSPMRRLRHTGLPVYLLKIADCCLYLQPSKKKMPCWGGQLTKDKRRCACS